MKQTIGLVLVVGAIVAIATPDSAEARRGRRDRGPVIIIDDHGWDHQRHRRHRRHRRHHEDIVVHCAPEVVEGNVNATSRILAEVALLPEFSGATQFNAKVQEIGVLETEEKINAYFGLLDIDPKNNVEVLEFIGAREVDSRYLQSLSAQLDLTNDQAALLAEKMQKGMLGGLSQ